MKYYKDKNNQIWAYEDNIPEFGSYTEIETVNDEESETVIEKVYPEFTVKEGLIAIMEEEANEINAKNQAKLEGNAEIYIPQVLSRFQALTVLKLTKINETTTLYQATDDYIKSLDGDTTKEIVIQTAWETASEFRRDSTLINTCKEMFHLTDEQVDEMFIHGSEITA
ncbi:hypothetical protein [Orbus mooreae]|uniref:hypothetical protein n=1 Tax=Orbus mooreae TaxID=3074107 RepID=UPI00370D7816